jgi:hypothetical protein
LFTAPLTLQEPEGSGGEKFFRGAEGKGAEGGEPNFLLSNALVCPGITMSNSLSILKSLGDLKAPDPIPQYRGHAKDEFQPCNCKCCFEDMIMHGAIVVTRIDDEWRPKTITVSDKECMEGHHKDSLLNLLIMRGKTHFFDHVITDNLRALPRELAPGAVSFHNVKPLPIPPVMPNCTCDECNYDSDDSEVDDDDSVVIRKRQWEEEEEEEEDDEEILKRIRMA